MTYTIMLLKDTIEFKNNSIKLNRKLIEDGAVGQQLQDCKNAINELQFQIADMKQAIETLELICKKNYLS